MTAQGRSSQIILQAVQELSHAGKCAWLRAGGEMAGLGQNVGWGWAAAPHSSTLLAPGQAGLTAVTLQCGTLH